MSSVYRNDTIVTRWFVWHFLTVPRFLFLAWENVLSFGVYYFSVPLLLLTLFSPWKKYNWSYPKGFDIGGYFATLISNVFSRFIGAFCRLCLIFIGILFQIVLVVLGGSIILAWFLLPVISVLLLLLLLYGF